MGYKIVLPYGAITLVGDVPNRRIVILPSNSGHAAK